MGWDNKDDDQFQPGAHAQRQRETSQSAPHVTPADIEASIAYETFFTASQGALAADGDAGPEELGLLTICVLVLKNGFIVTGEYAFPSAERFNAEVGRRIARHEAVSKVWTLVDYEMCTQMARQKMTKAEALAHVATGSAVRRAIPEWNGGASLVQQDGAVVMTDGVAAAVPYENLDPDDRADWVAIGGVLNTGNVGDPPLQVAV